MAQAKTVEGQNIRDLTVRYYGDVNSMPLLLNQFDDLNVNIPTGKVITVEETNNNIVTLFETNETNIATSSPEGTDIFDFTFDESFN